MTGGLNAATSLPMPSNVKQIDGLQMLRAVAVVLVIWGHAAQVLDSHAPGEGLPSFGVFGIDIFFVISGFILSLSVLKERELPSIGTMWEFMKRRLIRIYPMYWFFSLVLFARFAHAHQLMAHNYLPSFFLVPYFRYPGYTLIMGLSWTLNFEMFFYVILGLVLLKTVRFAVQALIVVLVSSVAIGYCTGIRHAFWIVACNPILLEFVFGSILSLLYTRFGRRRSIGVFLTVTGVVATIFLQIHGFPAAANSPQMILVDKGPFYRVITWGVCAALIVGGIVFWSPSMKSTFGEAWVIVGNASYSIYVSSTIVIEFASRFLFSIGSSSPALWNRIFYEVSMLATIVAAGLVCYLVLEQPLLKVLQRRLLRKKVPTIQLPSSIGESGPKTPTLA